MSTYGEDFHPICHRNVMFSLLQVMHDFNHQEDVGEEVAPAAGGFVMISICRFDCGHGEYGIPDGGSQDGPWMKLLTEKACAWGVVS